MSQIVRSAAQTPFLEALSAPGPVTHLAEELNQFGRFVGSWDLEVTYFHPDGSVKREVPGEWHFGWVLEGRAIQDVWIVPPREQRAITDPAPGEYGMTLRFYDERIGAWRSTWHGPVHGIIWAFIARQVGEEMVLERSEENGELSRWIFSQITPESFHWRAVTSSDAGRSWRLDQVMRARRR